MNMQQSFAPERAIAQHCADLTERGPRPEERAALLSLWRREVARHVEADIAPLFLGAKLKAAVGEPERMRASAVFDKIGPIAVNCLLRCGPDGQTALLSLDFATALALTDRSFGGEGAVSDNPDDTLPSSAGILIDRFAQAIANAVSRASNRAASEAASRLGEVVQISESISRLKPFGSTSDCVALKLSVGEASEKQWSMLLVLLEDQLDNTLSSHGVAKASESTRQGLADPFAAPFADMPMPLDAILTEVDLSLDRLEALKVGDEIPLPIPRDVPLRIDARAVASGSLGVLDDRMAVRITRLHPGGLNS